MQYTVHVALVSAVLASSASGASGRFSLDGLAGWEAQTFRNRAATAYSLERIDSAQVLKAECKASASGLIRRETVDLHASPTLSWRWRVESVYAGIDERTKAGDDFPARIYVVREGGWAPWRTRALMYVWASAAPSGAHWASPYASQAHVVVLRSGPSSEWKEERRNVREDFQKFLGITLDAIDGIALMSDCDDAGGSARAWFGNLGFE